MNIYKTCSNLNAVGTNAMNIYKTCSNLNAVGTNAMNIYKTCSNLNAEDTNEFEREGSILGLYPLYLPNFFMPTDPGK